MKSLALSLMFVFGMAVVAPAFAQDAPVAAKTETAEGKKCCKDGEKKACCAEKKQDCPKEKKSCCKKDQKAADEKK